MSLLTRITLWQAGILLISLVVMALVFHYELVENWESVQQGKYLDGSWFETGEFLLYYGAPTALLLLAGAAFLIRRALRPVTRLTEAAQRMRLNHLHERLPAEGTGDELDRLTRVFNSMAERLQESFGRIREFTLHASHEIKTPLTIMRGELEGALRDDACPVPQRELLGSLLDEVNRLAKIVDGLTLLAKADGGLLTLHLAPVDLADLVQDSFTDAQVLAQPSEITVRLKRCDVAKVQADRGRLRQLLLNLVDNAVKYNQQGGHVDISLACEGEWVELQITNSGPGIPADKLPRVFDRFVRGDHALAGGIEGCGLGLTISEWIARAHGGTIQLVSVPGQTTVATVRLPINGVGVAERVSV